MSVCAARVRFACRARYQVHVPVADLPAFLCPALITAPRGRHQRRQLYSTLGQTILTTPHPSKLPSTANLSSPKALINRLPQQCGGCGALSQTINPNEPGYYNPKRRSVNDYLKGRSSSKGSEENAIIEKSFKAAADIDPDLSSKLELFTGVHRSGTRTILVFHSLKYDLTNNSRRSRRDARGSPLRALP
jgi:hypothetical protein